jgi:hypothetical protein
MDSDKTLVIYCTFKMIIRQLCYAAARNSSLGWLGTNGDIFKNTVSLLAKRHGQTILVHMDGKGKNTYKQHAYSLALEALKIPQTAVDFQPTLLLSIECATPHTALGNKVKVKTDLPETSPENPKPWMNWQDTEDKGNESHRGRGRVYALKNSRYQELMAASSKGIKGLDTQADRSPSEEGKPRPCCRFQCKA